MAEGKIFLKENRDRIEKKYREQVMGLPQAFAEIDKKLAECTDEVALGTGKPADFTRAGDHEHSGTRRTHTIRSPPLAKGSTVFSKSSSQ